MTSVSQYLSSLGLDPFFIGLIVGALAVVLFIAAKKAAQQSAKASGADPFTAPQPSAAPKPFALTKTVHFRFRLNGQDHSLTDAQTSSVLAAIRSGDQDQAMAIVQNGLSVTPDVAKTIVEALKTSHLP